MAYADILREVKSNTKLMNLKKASVQLDVSKTQA